MLADEKSSTTLVQRIVAGALVAGLVGTSLAPVILGLRQLGGGGASSGGGAISRSVVSEKLRRVPLFAVTDETGRPFMSEAGDKRTRVGYFFISPSDAERFLGVVKETAGDEATLARIRIVSLEDAVPFIGRRATGGGKNGVPERFEIVADEGEAGIASTMTDGKFEKSYRKGVPLFFVDTLALQGKEGDEPVIPLFFEKEKLDSFLEKARQNGSAIEDGQIQVIDLMQTVRELREGANSQLKQVVLFPMGSAMDYEEKVFKSQ